MLRVNKITDCMDVLSLWETSTRPERVEILQTVINTVGGYPKPRHKGETIEPTPETLGAYLCISNVRNYSKLGALGVLDIETAYIMICRHLETALTLLID